MPTTTIILLICLALLLPWTIYLLLKDLIRKMIKPTGVRDKSDKIRDAIAVEREKDRARMGSMFASSVMKRGQPQDGDKG